MAIDLNVNRAAPTASMRSPQGTRNQPGANGTMPFGDLLGRVQQDLHLSNHANKRIDSRDLNLDANAKQRLNSAIDSAAQKGSRSSVVLLDNLAMVVDVRQRTVVTAMEKQEGKQRVFTNVDSVVIA
ncbi:hypothetical protein AYO38_02880 [bacterium SCGC AG-212-C10]|nr:hypothetical protein AYO38_02880 [bacterium SCGC AG-212-C10]